MGMGTLQSRCARYEGRNRLQKRLPRLPRPGQVYRLDIRQRLSDPPVEIRTTLRWFVIGIATTVVVIIIGGYVIGGAGGVPMETTARPLPFEETVAKTALRAAIGNAAEQKNPLVADDTSMLAGVTIFKQNCAICHSIPGQPPSAI